MKRILTTLAVITAFAATTSITSCTKTCDAGYEGTKCDVQVREKIVGTYSVDENCTVTGHAVYNVTITKSSSDVQKVLITPFGGYNGVTATVTVDGTSLAISSSTSGGFTFSGSGTIGGGGSTISMTYTISDGVTTESCSGTWTKQ